MVRNKTINVKGTEIVMYQDNQQEFISLTDIARYRDTERSDYILQNWLRNRSTIDFIGLWEQFNNPGFNSIEFDGIKNMAGANSFSLTPKRWIGATGRTVEHGKHQCPTYPSRFAPIEKTDTIKRSSHHAAKIVAWKQAT